VGGAQLGLVVYMGLHVGEENAAHECYGMAGALAEACLATSQSKLGKIFSHYRKKQYPNMESFFDELAKAFVEAFFPTHAATAFNFLFDVLDKLEENWKGASSTERSCARCACVRVRWCVRLVVCSRHVLRSNAGGSAVAAAGYHKAVLVLLRYLTAEVDLVILPQPKVHYRTHDTHDTYDTTRHTRRLRNKTQAAYFWERVRACSWPSGCRAWRDS
jgi:hypothetical protein